MIAELIQKGFFRQITTEGRKTYILQHPVQVVVKANVLADLRRIYPLHNETGGILYAFPSGQNLVITRFTQLANQLTGEDAKTAYKPYNSLGEINNALAAGALPIRFHSHPVEIFENPYDKQPLLFFQKTSVADRHNAYLPLTIEGYTIVLPDGLLSPNDHLGSDVRFYLYGGLIAPDSIQALFTDEKLYIYFSVIAIVLTLFFGTIKTPWIVLVVAGLLSIVVFALEKRPTGVKNSDGDLIIQIY